MIGNCKHSAVPVGACVARLSYRLLCFCNRMAANFEGFGICLPGREFDGLSEQHGISGCKDIGTAARDICDMCRGIEVISNNDKLCMCSCNGDGSKSISEYDNEHGDAPVSCTN